MRQSCIGLLSWICYTAVGLAYMPIDILKGQRHIDRLQATIEERESLLGNRYAQIREKAWRQGVGSLSRRERRDAEVSEHSRCARRTCIESLHLEPRLCWVARSPIPRVRICVCVQVIPVNALEYVCYFDADCG